MAETPSFDPRIQSENIAFDPSAMVKCGGCGRMNPPNRLKCIYCAKVLALSQPSSTAIKLTLRKLELWEKGFNLVVREQMARPQVLEAAKFLSIESDNVEAVLEAGVPLPIARVESEAEAKLVQDGLAACGIGCSIVGDDELDAERLPVRLSGLEFVGDRCVPTDFNTGERAAVPLVELSLIVPGIVTIERVDSLEKKRRGGKTKLIDETATASDEMLLDLYTRHSRIGYRINLTGFDFSCLGDDKGLLAGENMRLLIVHLIRLLPNARLINDYTTIRHTLDRVWEIGSRKDSQGLQRSGFGKVEFGSTASRSNLYQFTKFSRLQWHLL
jgi:hypothetical protein